MSAAPYECSICADAADRAVIRQLHGHDAEVEVTCSGQRVTVAVDLITGARVGDTVLVHQGVAIARAPQLQDAQEEGTR